MALELVAKITADARQFNETMNRVNASIASTEAAAAAALVAVSAVFIGIGALGAASVKAAADLEKLELDKRFPTKELKESQEYLDEYSKTLYGMIDRAKKLGKTLLASLGSDSLGPAKALLEKLIVLMEDFLKTDEARELGRAFGEFVQALSQIPITVEDFKALAVAISGIVKLLTIVVQLINKIAEFTGIFPVLKIYGKIVSAAEGPESLSIGATTSAEIAKAQAARDNMKLQDEANRATIYTAQQYGYNREGTR